MKSFRFRTVVWAVILASSCLCPLQARGEQACRVVQQGKQVELCSPSFVFRLNTAKGLHAQSWENRLTGKTIKLGEGSELDVDLDAADERIWIRAWKGRGGQAQPAETTVTLPASGRGKKVSLTLGTPGLFSYRHITAAINGHDLGTHHAPKRWNPLAVFEIKPDSEAYRSLKFGGPNRIEVGMNGLINKSNQLQEVPDSGLWHHNRARWGHAFEQYVTVGEHWHTPAWKVTGVENRCGEGSGKAGQGEVVISLAAEGAPLSATVTYRWSADEPVLHKFVTLTNTGKEAQRVMNVRLGEYSTGVEVTEGECGFPVHIAGQFFMSLAHPSGWAMGQEGNVWLKQYPGIDIAPGKRFELMEAVYGVAPEGQARRAFKDHVRSRCRRTRRGHDRPYAIFEPFGAKPDGNFDETEQFVLNMIGRVDEFQKQTGCHFDRFSIDFWVDRAGDITQADPKRFPHGLGRVCDAARAIGVDPGLWITGSRADWSIGKNPEVRPAYARHAGPDRPLGYARDEHLCRATDPVKRFYREGFLHHVRENGVRLVKFDGTFSACYNTDHAHLPGLYSNQHFTEGEIDTLVALDQAHPDVFLMLYWGHRSPWWLLWADTQFECGLAIEAREAGPYPTLYVRDGVTQTLDRGVRFAADVPLIGQDSLGVWLSSWPWNHRIGTERWQEGFLMDICRGSMLAQPWSDWPLLDRA